MTIDQKRRRIAELTGWVPETRRAEIPEADFVHEETFWKKDGEVRRGPWLPDTYTDANEAVKLLDVISKTGAIYEIGNYRGTNLIYCRVTTDKDRFYVESKDLKEAISDCFLKVKGTIK